jgi:murein DD-endopeptidase MepM/ murein hydrolase activator NlpD
LETFPNELNIAVPVRSIAEGMVREVSPVSGYGGLIVIEYSLGGNTYTAYFGHINLATATVKAGDHVTAGEHIVDLGPQCSSTNGNVRKHLHFGLHKGSSIDVRGYVPDQSILSNWVDPKTLLASLGAQ